MSVVARLGRQHLVRVATYAAFTLTALWPMYYAGGAFTLYWHYPLPLALLRNLAGLS